MLSDRVRHERLARVCHCDYDREMTLVAEHLDSQSGERLILGAGRLSKLHGINAARFSMIISDHFQDRGWAPNWYGGWPRSRLMKSSTASKPLSQATIRPCST